jgi:hypothetical protein
MHHQPNGGLLDECCGRRPAAHGNLAGCLREHNGRLDGHDTD